MSQRASPTVVGSFVVGALALLVLAVLVFGSGALLRERISVVAFFAGNVRGLQEGSAVEFRGVRVGTVKRIQLFLDVNQNELLIPVHMELETRSLSLAGSTREAPSEDVLPFLDELVTQGLRARLDLKSFVTGQLAVNLDMHPGTQVVRVGAIEDVYELPTVTSTLDRVVAVLQDLPLQEIATKLIDALDDASRLFGDEQIAAMLSEAATTAIDARRFVSELRVKIGPTIDEVGATLRETRAVLLEIRQHANSTLDEYARLANDAGKRMDSLTVKAERTVVELGGIRATLDARMAPLSSSAMTALREARGALAGINDLVAEDSRTRYNLDKALEELAAAARSLRIMADYLERNPDALIKGKGR